MDDKDTAQSAPHRLTVDEIQKATADHFGLKQADLLSERRTRAIARPRQVAMWICKNHTTRSYPDIGRRFGGRDHTTVLHAVKKIDELRAADDKIGCDIAEIRRRLKINTATITTPPPGNHRPPDSAQPAPNDQPTV